MNDVVPIPVSIEALLGRVGEAIGMSASLTIDSSRGLMPLCL